MLFKWNKGGGRGFKSSYIYIYIYPDSNSKIESNFAK